VTQMSSLITDPRIFEKQKENGPPSPQDDKDKDEELVNCHQTKVSKLSLSVSVSLCVRLCHLMTLHAWRAEAGMGCSFARVTVEEVYSDFTLCTQ
jgi:hypothetical protein